ncbi:MFS transporter [Halorientalis salina]|uniref:MFS transporter n=1 Tax=Halorientalis salina TaxID=2932266 RepID=UPI00145E59A9|nr:MFS transporter [Halorientalis salina]
MGKRRLWAAALFLFVVGDGMTTQVRGALLPSIKESFTVSDSLLGLVAPAGTLGYLFAAVAVGFAASRLDTRRFLLLGAGGTVLFLALLSQVPTYALLLVFLLGQGATIGIFRGLDRPLLSSLYPENRGRLFNLYALTWAVGATAGPLFVNQVLTTSDWRVTFLILAAVFLPAFGLITRLELPSTREKGDPFSLSELRGLFRRPGIAGMALALFFSGGIEGGFFTWLPYYASQYVPQTTANVVLSGFLVAYIPGRFVYSRLAGRIEPLTLVLSLALAAMPALAFVFFASDGYGLLPGVFVIGFLVSGFFPTLSAFGIDTVPNHGGPVNAIAISANFLGLSVVPVIMGVVSDQYAITTAMRLLILAMAALALVVAASKRRVDRGAPTAGAAD